MRKLFSIIVVLMIGVPSLWSQHANVVWNSPSRNSSESMPCGGGDIGLNVWVEKGDLLFYISRSGTFDEHNCLLKQGRVRLRLSPNPFLNASDFRQELKLNEGYVEVSAGGTTIQLWVDVFHPLIHVELQSRQALSAEVFYENWRYKDRLIRKGEGQQNSYKWVMAEGLATTKDSVVASKNEVMFYHHNPSNTVFDVAVAQQGMDAVKDKMMNPIKHLTFGGKLWGSNLSFLGTKEDVYAGTDYRAWHFRSVKPTRKQQIHIALYTQQTADIETWKEGLTQVITGDFQKYKKRSHAWWNAFWQRSFIVAKGEAEQITRNYTLFRYMLGCNAYGSAPTKFNGGLFTFDPLHVDEKLNFTPDFRKWGGGTMTAQNQRLVYWPMLKSGDADLMIPQFKFYLAMLGNAELRSKVYWNHPGACFAEQIENFGLPNPAEYGFKRPDYFDKGIEYNAWLEYEWDTVLEFCQMILETKDYAGADISLYLPLVDSALTFFDEHYRYLARQRGRKELDGNGHLILFPGSACETYKMTNNASSTIAALRTVLQTYGRKPEMLAKIPPISLRTVGGKEMISPAKTWERINNVETPQLYPVFPWRIYGVGKDSLEIARNTYLYDADALKFRSHVGWKQDNIWAACLGLTDEAKRLTLLKLADGPYRFPAFWGPGFDWSPDHNWGGSGMIGLQEMLLQTNGDKILLFPAWPPEWDVHFKLHAPMQTTVEAELKAGKLINLKVTPESRRKDIELWIK
ncbi:DUF5703 domain-containing protein [Bacteroides ihuae]|uniref:DUF5703 domain-containing protein n=1 Tax=Bacteroides ihuae TaxID=1852362 RepID=UPI0008DAE30C|nr:DUF5703 domain-containing protein [Bacteroides ihuae]